MPPNLFQFMKQLVLLDLGNNALTGPLPHSLSCLELCEMLYLQHNQFCGKLACCCRHTAGGEENGDCCCSDLDDHSSSSSRSSYSTGPTPTVFSPTPRAASSSPISPRQQQHLTGFPPPNPNPNHDHCRLLIPHMPSLLRLNISFNVDLQGGVCLQALTIAMPALELYDITGNVNMTGE